MSTKEDQIKNLLTRNVEQIIERDYFEKALTSGKKLRVKLGIDPTSPDLHLGHAVILRKLKEFQDLGHKIVLIIGDFTGQIGDPSGRTEARKVLTEKEVKVNMKKYLVQAAKVLDIKKVEIIYNSAWFKKEGIAKIVELSRAGSIQQILRRAEFKKRLEEGNDITLLEALYPLFQGYDSVMVKADVEIGGTDQTFNLLMGRRVQRHFGMKEQDIITTPLLEGLDGIKKMSKSLGNYIGLTDTPDDMFGKIMSLPDNMMRRYFLLCTDRMESEVQKLEKELSPRDLKARLAFEIVKIYHGEKKAKAAEEKFTKIFTKKDLSAAELPEFKVKTRKLSVLDLILSSRVVNHSSLKSKSEAQRLISQGAIQINGETKKDMREIVELKDDDILKIGKKNFFRIKI